jgi:5-(hydroxymethyl)furfural/furfural oxidase
MRSGIGPAAHLADLGIQLRADRRGVGQNLQDHPAVGLATLLKKSAAQDKKMRSHANLALRYSSTLTSCDPLDMYIVVSNKTSWHALGQRLGYMAILLQQPLSRGHVALKTPRADDAPAVTFNLLTDSRDLIRLEQGLRFAFSLNHTKAVTNVIHDRFLATFSKRVQAYNRISRSNAVRSWIATQALDRLPWLRPWLLHNIIAPRANADLVIGQHNELEEWIKTNVTGYYHVAGTCRLGRSEDPLAVVGPSGKVHGISGLRVADNSIMPVLVKSQANLTAMMIGEKIADAVKAESA